MNSFFPQKVSPFPSCPPMSTNVHQCPTMSTVPMSQCPNVPMSQCPRMSQCPTHHPHALPARDDDSSSSSSMDEDHAAHAARAAHAGAPAPAAAAPSHAAEMPSNALAVWAHHPPSWSLSTLFHVSLVLFVSTFSTVYQCHRIDRCPCPHVHVPCPKCIHVHVQCPHRAPGGTSC